jgi:hypothetical protein
MNAKIQAILSILQLVLTFGNVCVIGYAFIKFIGKPRDDIITKVNALEYEIKEIKRSLMQGNDRFRAQDSTNEVIIRSVVALIDFEVHYCETEQRPLSKSLEKARDELHEYFARNNHVY